MFIMASCAGEKSNTAQVVESINTSSPISFTATPVIITEVPTQTAVVLPTQINIFEATPPVTGNIPFDQVQPSPDDSKMKQGKVFIDQITLQKGTLLIKGSLPTPCHKLRIELNDPMYANFTVSLSIYSLRDDSLICIQSLAPFQVNIPLKTIPDGTYIVNVNDVSQLTFSWPEK